MAPAAYSAGLEHLSIACPAGVPDDRWRLALVDAERFLGEWGEAAERLGWTEADLFDLHPTVPLSRIDRMGLVWLLKGERVVLLTEAEVRLERGLALYRRPAALSHVEASSPAISAEDWQAYFDERAAIREFDGGMTRYEAEMAAYAETVAASGRRRALVMSPRQASPQCEWQASRRRRPGGHMRSKAAWNGAQSRRPAS